VNDVRPGLDPVHLYGYLNKAREKLLGWVRPLTVEQYTQEFPFGLKTLRDTLVEIPQAEWAYVRRLQGEPVPAWQERPFARFYRTEFAPFEAALRAQAEETAKALGEISDWARPVEYPVVYEGKPLRIRTTTGGIAAPLPRDPSPRPGDGHAAAAGRVRAGPGLRIPHVCVDEGPGLTDLGAGERVGGA